MASVFQKLGGIRPMAAKLGDVPPSTVKSWHANGKIPAWRHGSILEAARRAGVALSRDELENVRADDPVFDDATCTPVTSDPDPALVAGAGQ